MESNAVINKISERTNVLPYVTQNELILLHLTAFYEKGDHFAMFKNVVVDKVLSLRIIDWFVTNFAKQNGTKYDFTNERGAISRFNVYGSYKLKLKTYSKEKFDPFGRGTTMIMKNVETTLGQLNFFKWAIENNIIQYILDNQQEILQDMNARGSTSRRVKKNDGCKTRKKREELSISAMKHIKKEHVEILISFN